MLEELENTEIVVTVGIGPISQAVPDNLEDAVNGNPTGSRVGWDSSMQYAERTGLVDEDGQPRSTPEADLANEMQHAHDLAFGNLDMTDSENRLTPSYERSAVETQNRVLEAQGRSDTRDTYTDWDRSLTDKVRDFLGNFGYE